MKKKQGNFYFVPTLLSVSEGLQVARFDNFWMDIKLSKITFLGKSVEEKDISYQKLQKIEKKVNTKS